MPENLREKIDAANEEALRNIINSQPKLKDIRTAAELFPDMKENDVYHAGPPIRWQEMTGSMKGAVMGALQYEGLAKSADEAAQLAAGGEINFTPNHEHGGVGGMTGIITRSMPLYCVENEPFGVGAYAGVLTDRIIFGGYDQAALDDLHWMNNTFAPALREAIHAAGGIDIKEIQAQALHMNDEMHNRSNAATALFTKKIAPYLVEAVDDRQVVAEMLRFWDQTPSFFTFIGMGASKATMLAAHNIEYSSIVTVMSRNGVEFGIWISGLGDRWFTGEAAPIIGPTFPGYEYDDAERDIGDSCITETAGIGAFVMAGAPAILRLVGGTVEEALRYTNDMYEITVGRNPAFSIPNLNFRSTPVGIDIRSVVETNMVPIIDTAMAHKEAGVGEMIGAGMVTPPIKPFQDALRAFFMKYAA